MIERIGWRGWILVALWNVAMAFVILIGKSPEWCTWCIAPDWLLLIFAGLGAASAVVAGWLQYRQLGVSAETEL